MIKLVGFCFSLAMFALLVSCGSKNTTTDNVPSASTIDQLPAATGRVVSNTADAFWEVGFDNDGIMTKAATTGLAIKAATGASFTTGKSRAMCEAVNLTKQLLDRAAGADRTLCYIQKTLIRSVNQTTLSSAGVNIYDGNYHTLTLNMTDPNVTNAAPKFKMKVVKSGSGISEFVMYGCFGGTAAAPIQTEYIRQAITGSDITITSKNVDPSGSSNKGSMIVTGKLNTSLVFKEKTMVAEQTYGTAGANNSNSSMGTLIQSADDFVFSGFNQGRYGNMDYSNKVYMKYQLLDTNATTGVYDLGKLYIGDGSAKVVMSSGITNERTVSWTGDDKAQLSDAASGMYYATVNAGAVPALNTVSISFTSDQTWDCSDTSEATVAVDQAQLDSDCAVYSMYANNNYSWFDCYTSCGNN
ncbi:MAG: hypothetical protein HQK51_08900 [Oligoflexia bacterium]|nr:hypothetical protein [Oligoflexia bacterium]